MMEYLIIVMVLLVMVGQVYAIRQLSRLQSKTEELHTTAVPPKAEPNRDILA